MSETIPASCMECTYYIYKGEDEQFCSAAWLREVHLHRHQKKPKWCPMERRAKKNESHA